MLKTTDAQSWLLVAMVCVLSGLVWSLFPAVGWSYYALEGAHTSCSVKWEDPSVNVVSYNIAIFIFVFAIPLIFMLVTNYKLVFLVNVSYSNINDL